MTDLTTRAPDPLSAVLADPERLQGLPIDTVEKLFALHREATADAAKRAHAAALADFQSRASTIAYNARGAHNARYATLDHILDTVRAPLAECGLSVSFDSEEADDGRLRVWAIVHHIEGHETRAQFTVSREAKSNRMNDTQRDGSALSYGRRYALSLALGITTGERDDDGRGADIAEPVTAEQAANLQALCEETGSDIARMCEWASCESLEAFPARRYREAVKMLERKREQS